MSKQYRGAKLSATIANGASVSSAVKLFDWVVFAGVLFPNMDNGDIGIEISPDSGVNYYPLLDVSTGADLVVCTTGNDPGWVDISDFVRFVNSSMLMRFTCAAQSAERTLEVAVRG